MDGRVQRITLPGNINKKEGDCAPACAKRIIDNERQRIAADLHDGVNQDLCLVKLLLEMALDNSVGSLNETSRGIVQSAIQGVSDILLDIRNIIDDLDPVLWEQSEIKKVFHKNLEMYRRAYPKINLIEQVDNSVFSNAHYLFSVLMRIMQEALGNACVHANPDTIWLRLVCEKKGILLSIRDNGSGFSVDISRRKGMGLKSMRNRAESTRGEFSLISAPGHGTSVTVFWSSDKLTHFDISPFSIA